MKSRFKVGDTVSGWELEAFLGKGGNAEVWRARRDGSGSVAVKLLTNRSPESRERFRREVAILGRHKNEAGVMPMLSTSESNPADGAEYPWLSMPVAQVSYSVVSGSRDPREVVSAMCAIGRTLLSLSGKGVFHRDVKPANVFRLNNEWVIGDFGLALDQAQTRSRHSNRRGGPLEFTAPEVLRSPRGSEPGPADVYSICKTLWALMTGERFPPPGRHALNEPTMILAARLRFDGVHFLDELVSKGTDNDPAKRPSLSDLVRGLEEWLTRPQHQPGLRPMEVLIRELSDLSAAAEAVAGTRDVAQREAERIHLRLDRFFKKVVDELHEKGQDKNLLHHTNPAEDGLLARRDNQELNGLVVPYRALWFSSTGLSWMAFNNALSPMLAAFATVLLVDDTRIAIFTGIQLSNGFVFIQNIWRHEEQIERGSMTTEKQVAWVETELAERLIMGVEEMKNMTLRFAGRPLPSSTPEGVKGSEGGPNTVIGRRVELLARSALTGSQVTQMDELVRAPEHQGDRGGVDTWGASGYEKNQVVAVELATGKPFGLIYVGPSSIPDNVGWWCASQFRGKGLMKEAVDRLAELICRENASFEVGPITIDTREESSRSASKALVVRLRAKLRALKSGR